MIQDMDLDIFHWYMHGLMNIQNGWYIQVDNLVEIQYNSQHMSKMEIRWNLCTVNKVHKVMDSKDLLDHFLVVVELNNESSV